MKNKITIPILSILGCVIWLALWFLILVPFWLLINFASPGGSTYVEVIISTISIMICIISSMTSFSITYYIYKLINRKNTK